MEDRKLLELAAKAAGFRIVTARFSDPGNRLLGVNVVDERGDERLWNPLRRNAEASRLAVKLDLYGEVRMSEAFMRAAISVDREASYRREIVIAAAGIGRAMP